MLDELEIFTPDMFRVAHPKIYAVGPKSCGKTYILHRLNAAGWDSWKPIAVETHEFETFMCIPQLENQYFILFNGSEKYECAKKRLPKSVQDKIQALKGHECLLYDPEKDLLYKPGF